LIAALTDQIAVIACGIAFLLFCLYMAAYRPIIFVSFFFIIFTLVWRTCSMMFIDLAGPVYSSQTFLYVGPGTVTCVHVLAYAVTLTPFFLLLQPSSVQAWLRRYEAPATAPGMLTLSDLTFCASGLFLAWLFVDLILHGAIPRFSHMERFVYTAEYAGSAHRWLTSYGSLLAFWWGVMFAAERLRNRRLDPRYLALLAVLVLYLFLTGNRFSAFYSLGSFFVMPLSAIIAVAAKPHSNAAFANLRPFAGQRELIAMGATAVLLVGAAVVGIYNNLTMVRGYQGSEIESHFIERALIQPSELGWLSYQRVFEFGEWTPYRVFDFLFQSPIDPNKNTTPQYLMLTTIGEPRTHEHISGGFQFAGGFPEIFFELFGPVLAWPFLAAAGFIAAGLTALVVKGVIQGRYASAFLAMYVLYGFYVMYIGGMLNFVAVGTYWIKVVALLLALLLEARLARSGLPLLPWALFPLRKTRFRTGAPAR
jgi:hypothetical protein